MDGLLADKIDHSAPRASEIDGFTCTARCDMNESTESYTSQAVDAFCIIYRVWRNRHGNYWTGQGALELVNGSGCYSNIGM